MWHKCCWFCCLDIIDTHYLFVFSLSETFKVNTVPVLINVILAFLFIFRLQNSERGPGYPFHLHQGGQTKWRSICWTWVRGGCEIGPEKRQRNNGTQICWRFDSVGLVTDYIVFVLDGFLVNCFFCLFKMHVKGQMDLHITSWLVSRQMTLKTLPYSRMH